MSYQSVRTHPSCLLLLGLLAGCHGTQVERPTAATEKSSSSAPRSDDSEVWFEIGGFYGESDGEPVQDLGYCWLRMTEAQHEGRRAWLLIQESYAQGFSAAYTGFRNGKIQTLSSDDGWLTPMTIECTDRHYQNLSFQVRGGRIHASLHSYSAGWLDEKKMEWMP